MEFYIIYRCGILGWWAGDLTAVVLWIYKLWFISLYHVSQDVEKGIFAYPNGAMTFIQLIKNEKWKQLRNLTAGRIQF